MNEAVPPLLTKAERWLYQFCSTRSVSGVSGPNVSVRELLEAINGLRETRNDLLAALEGAVGAETARCEAWGMAETAWLTKAQAAIAKAKLPT